MTGDLFHSAVIDQFMPMQKLERVLIFPPASRATDPESSKLAEVEITNSGKRERQQMHALLAVREAPGLTSRELSVRFSLDRYMLARRLSEMAESAHGLSRPGPILLRQGEIRVCTVSNRPAVTWYPLGEMA